MKKVYKIGVLLLGILSLASCSNGTIYDYFSSSDEKNSTTNEYTDSTDKNNNEENVSATNNTEFYCSLPSSFAIGEIIYFSDNLISDPSISLGDLIGYLVNNGFNDEKEENLIYVAADFKTNTNDVSLPLYLLDGKTLEEAIVVHTSLFDFVYTTERSLK